MSKALLLERTPTGVPGLDLALGGGLPRGRTTLVLGSPGAGKTILALQALAQGARNGEPGVFLTFEESPSDILANIAAFSWAPPRRAMGRLSIMDGRNARTAFLNGGFDLVGLLSAAEYRCRRIKARRIVLDGIDVLLDMIDDPAVMRREVYRLSDWLSKHALTAIITGKKQQDGEALPSRYAFLPFLTDCVVVLEHRVIGRTAMRELRILKCRGVAHCSNEMPMVISSSGIEIDPPRSKEMEHPVSSQRISTGIERLDTMLEGGYLRGTCTLVSGAPGTAKTSLAGAFAEAACRRGERTLFVSFEESGKAIARNLASVNIRLGRFVRSEMLRVYSVPASGSMPEALTLRIGALLAEHDAQCLVIDPVSGLSAEGEMDAALDALLSLLDLARRRGTSVLLTASILSGSDPTEENSATGLSSISDTWMHLSYVAADGERNRALTIVKSRGTGHSNQVRELVLSRDGLSLVDVYTAGGAVLMGTMRREAEEQERAGNIGVTRIAEAQHEVMTSAIAETETRIATLQIDLERKKAALRLLADNARIGAATNAANLAVLRRSRGADSAPRRLSVSIRPAARTSR
jgi:circadian clock protein KaiC